MTNTRRSLAWLAIFALVLLALAYFAAILLPFVAALVLAYLLDPLVGWLGGRGLPRWAAALLIVLGAAIVVVGAMALVLPALLAEVNNLVAAVPGLLARLQARLGIDGEFKDVLGSLAKLPAHAAGTVLNSLVDSGLAVVNALALALVTPVITYYVLADWPRLVAAIDDALPRRHASTVRRLAGEVDAVIAAFLRGQGLVCLILGVFYSIGLAVVGLDYAILAGLGAGILGFVPVVGTIAGLAGVLALALSQFWPSWGPILAVAGIMAAGQILEGNVLSPRLVGNRVGLHPVFVIFALFAAGATFGLVGLMVAVPLAAAVGVLIRHALTLYRLSDLYGAEPDAATPEPAKEEP